MNQTIFRGMMLAVSVCALSFVAAGQQRARRGGGLDNLSLPSTNSRDAATMALPDGMWRRVAPEGAGFSVLLPGTPEESTRAGREGGTVNSLFRGYRLAAGGVKYELTRTPPLPEQITALPGYRDKFFEGMEQGLTAALQAMNPQMKFRLAAQQAISVGGIEGREFAYVAAGHRATARVFLVNDCIYALTVLGPKSELTPETIKRFLDSFAVTR